MNGTIFTDLGWEIDITVAGFQMAVTSQNKGLEVNFSIVKWPALIRRLRHLNILLGISDLHLLILQG